MSERHLNTFTNGMSKDNDPQLQQSTTYRDALNGRIVFNEDGTLAFQNAKGTLAAINLTEGYLPIGTEEANGGKYCVIHSTNGTNSEIGFLTENVAGSIQYQVCFNDANDPNNQKLNFSRKHQHKMQVDYENDDVITDYWVDDYNEPRAFNIMARKSASWSVPYPDWYSVASMSSMVDFTPDMTQYVKTIGGTLPSGKFQYCYRLITKNKYFTPYTTPCGLITLSSNDVSATDWLQYQMANSGVNTNKGIEIVIENVDTRYSQIEVVAIYWQNDTTPITAYTFIKSDIPTSTNAFVSMTFQHTSTGGIEVSLANITQTYVDIARAKTNAIYRNHYHLGNVVLREKLEAVTDNIEIYPALRNILSDTKGSTTSLPFTNQTPSNTFLGHSDNCKPIKYIDANGNYVFNVGTMDNEYYNYKGTQIENRFKGYFRGETYPFALVLYDTKGQPMWAKHIADIGMPQQYADEIDTNTKTFFTTINGTSYTTNYIDSWDNITANTNNTQATDNNTFKPTQTDGGTLYRVSEGRRTELNQSVLRPLGLMFNNIDLTDLIYDADGKQVVSAFSIVRMPRYENIAFQGAMYPINNISSANYETINESGYYSPLAVAENYINIIHSPDKEFDNGLAVVNNDNCRIHILGAAYNDIWDTNNYIVNGSAYHKLSKDYQTQRIDTNSSGSSRFYNSAMASNTYHGIGDISIISSPPPSSTSYLGVNGYNGLSNYQFFTAQYSAVVSNDIAQPQINVKTSVTNYTYPAIPIVNYELGVEPPEITETELQGRIYNNIGHMVALTPNVIEANTNGSNRIIFNGVEVFGGDCYLSLVDYCRLIPYENATADDNSARILVFPCESKYNCDMRYGNQSAKVATRDKSGNTTFPNGIIMTTLSNVLEQWDINSVLQAEDNWRLFYPKPAFVAVDNQPTLHYYSDKKIVNSTIDSFRVFNPLNYDNVDGSYGEIIRMDKLFNELYLFQTSGFNRARFEERALVATTLGDLSTGTGLGLQGYDYVNKEFGMQQQFAFCKSGKAVYWIDAYKGKFLKFSQAGADDIVDAVGLHNYFIKNLKYYWGIPATYKIGATTYNVGQYSLNEEYNYVDNACGIDGIIDIETEQSGVGGINLCFDYKNNSVLINFSDIVYNLKNGDTFVKSEKIASAATLEYSEIENKFTSFFDIYPNIMFPFKSRVFMNYSPSNGSEFSLNALYLHDEGIRGNFFGTNKITTLEFAASPNLGLTKYFDNGRLNVNESGISLLTNVVASTQNIAPQTIVLNNPTADNRPIWREGVLRYPIMAKGQAQRMRDKDLILKFTITNDGSDKVVNITSHETIWRPSFKI